MVSEAVGGDEEMEGLLQNLLAKGLQVPIDGIEQSPFAGLWSPAQDDSWSIGVVQDDSSQTQWQHAMPSLSTCATMRVPWM